MTSSLRPATPPAAERDCWHYDDAMTGGCCDRNGVRVDPDDMAPCSVWCCGNELKHAGCWGSVGLEWESRTWAAIRGLCESYKLQKHLEDLQAVRRVPLDRGPEPLGYTHREFSLPMTAEQIERLEFEVQGQSGAAAHVTDEHGECVSWCPACGPQCEHGHNSYECERCKVQGNEEDKRKKQEAALRLRGSLDRISCDDVVLEVNTVRTETVPGRSPAGTEVVLTERETAYGAHIMLRLRGPGGTADVYVNEDDIVALLGPEGKG